MTLEIHEVVTDYWIYVKDGPGITTSGAQLQGGTGNVMPVSPLIVQGSKSSSKEPTKNTISYNAFLSSSFVTLQY